MMSALIVLMLVLAVQLTLPGAGERMSFYLIISLNRSSGEVGAMNQAFHLVCGAGGMAIFGSYVGKDRSWSESIHIIILLDTWWQ